MKLKLNASRLWSACLEVESRGIHTSGEAKKIAGGATVIARSGHLYTRRARQARRGSPSRPNRIASLAVASAMAAASISRQSVFGMRIVTGGSDVAPSVARFVPIEVIERLCAALRQRSTIPVARIIPVVDVAVESMTAVKPWAGSHKYPAHEPIGPIVAVGSTTIGRVIEVPIRAHRCHADVNRNLGMNLGRKTHQYRCHGCEGKSPELVHSFSNARIELQKVSADRIL
jgi:hypothetical protein